MLLMPQPARTSRAVAVNTYPQYAIDNGAAWHWSFDDLETSITEFGGDTNADLIANGSGTLAAFQQNPVTKRGKSIDFGVMTSTRRYQGVSGALTLTLPITTCVWVNMYASRAADSYIFLTHASGNYYGVYLIITTDGKLLIATGDGTGAGSSDRYTMISDNSVISDLTNHFITINTTAYNAHTVHVDNVSAPISYSSGTGASVSFASGAPMLGGNLVDNTFNLEGRVDELSVFDSSISAGVRGNLYTLGSTGTV